MTSPSFSTRALPPSRHGGATWTSLKNGAINANIDAVGYAPGELILFLKTLPREDQSRVCPSLPLGPVNALRSGLDLRVRSLAFQPTLRELLVAGGVMMLTAAVLFLGIMAAAG